MLTLHVLANYFQNTHHIYHHKGIHQSQKEVIAKSQESM